MLDLNPHFLFKIQLTVWLVHLHTYKVEENV